MTRVFKERLGIVWATLIVSLIFAFSHWVYVMFVGGEQPFTLDWFISLGSDFLFGVLMTVIVWRSHSILWGAFIHCMWDWNPWTLMPGRGWIQVIHLPAIGEAGIALYVIGLVGAELLRRSKKPPKTFAQKQLST